MKYFVGTYENKIDAKGRVSLPTAFRDIIKASGNSELYIFKSPTTNSLEAGGEDLMDYIASSIEDQAPMFSKEEEDLSYIMETSRLVSFDSSGRFIIPAEFSEFADIINNATFVGKARRFQIWNGAVFKKKSANSRTSFSNSKLTIQKPKSLIERGV